MDIKIRDILTESTVLLVDDEDKVRTIFKKTLEMYVKCVYEASDGDEALQLYNTYKPSIVISDIKMPLLDGASFIEILRKIDTSIPIVVISAYSESDVLLKLVSLKLTNYLIKPVGYSDLQNLLVQCAKELDEKGTVYKSIAEGVKYSYKRKALIKDSNIISLSPNEISLIELLFKHNNQLVSFEQIEAIVYNNENVSMSAINTLVSKLRKKIGKNNISSIHSRGYIFSKEV